MFQLLQEPDCEEIKEEIFKLEDHWVQRHESFPFYTLGASSYIDAAELGFEAYNELAQKQNPMLDEKFSSLFETLCAALSEQWQSDVVMHEALARPGFHIFLAHPAFSLTAGSIHFDRQFESIDWSDIAEVDTSQQRSLTLSIQLPRAGSGLKVWNVNYLTFGDLPIEERREVLRDNRKSEYHPYVTGHLAVHSGHQLHQIAPPPRMGEDDARVTLQAHAVPSSEKTWILYW
jgi:hypothetical protein